MSSCMVCEVVVVIIGGFLIPRKASRSKLSDSVLPDPIGFKLKEERVYIINLMGRWKRTSKLKIQPFKESDIFTLFLQILMYYT